MRRVCSSSSDHFLRFIVGRVRGDDDDDDDDGVDLFGLSSLLFHEHMRFF